jgi:hypothetical protein
MKSPLLNRKTKAIAGARRVGSQRCPCQHCEWWRMRVQNFIDACDSMSNDRFGQVIELESMYAEAEDEEKDDD